MGVHVPSVGVHEQGCMAVGNIAWSHSQTCTAPPRRRGPQPALVHAPSESVLAPGSCIPSNHLFYCHTCSMRFAAWRFPTALTTHCHDRAGGRFPAGGPTGARPLRPPTIAELASVAPAPAPSDPCDVSLPHLGCTASDLREPGTDRAVSLDLSREAHVQFLKVV